MKIQVRSKFNEKSLLLLSLITTIAYDTLVSIGVLSNVGVYKVAKYTVTFAPLIICGLMLFANARITTKRNKFSKELALAVAVMFLIGMLSLGRSIIQGAFTTETVLEIFQMLMPFVYTFFILNFLSFNEINRFMTVILFLTVAGYIHQLGGIDLSLDNILKTSIIRSTSPFENDTFAEMANGVMIYFLYFRKGNEYKTFVAVLLNFLCFKRVLMLMGVVLLIVVVAHKENRRLKNSTVYVIGTIMFLASIFLYWLYQPVTVLMIDSLFGVDLVSITNARIYRLWYVLENHFQSYGLGSTTLLFQERNLYWLGQEFEMDIIRILFEVGAVAVALLIFIYLKITKNNFYSTVVISICFLNLLMANGIVRYLAWTCKILTIGLINYCPPRRDMAASEIEYA